jgi:hypothetical protein
MASARWKAVTGKISLPPVIVPLPFAGLGLRLQAQERRRERRQAHPLEAVLRVLAAVGPSDEDRVAVFECLDAFGCEREREHEPSCSPCCSGARQLKRVLPVWYRTAIWPGIQCARVAEVSGLAARIADPSAGKAG